MILLIDNYDSFVYNLYHLIKDSIRDLANDGSECSKRRILTDTGKEIKVARNDKITIEEIKNLNPSYIFISPGPCNPSTAGVCLDLIKEFSGKIPIFGVCLGMQSIVQAFGGNIIKNYPVHGKVDTIEPNTNSPITPSEPFRVTRYHSLVAEEKTLPDCLTVCSRSKMDGQIMSVYHKEHKTAGVQYHPESIASERGSDIIKSFLLWASNCK